MTETPEPTIRVRVDPANPGQFFACCGLFLYKFWYRQLPSAEPVTASAEPVPELVETR